MNSEGCRTYKISRRAGEIPIKVSIGERKEKKRTDRVIDGDVP